MEKRLVVNADDFGFSPGVTEGILRAHGTGLVTSTTIAVNMPAADEAVRRLAEAPSLGVGVHLNVTQGPTLSTRGRALAGSDGVMDRTAMQLFGAILLRPWLLDAIEAECEAQIRWLLERGVRPTHLDSHRHVHGFWPIFARVARLARRYHIRFVRWYRESLPGRSPVASQRQRRVSRMLNAFGAGMARIAPDLRGTRGTLGVAHTGRIDEAWLIRAARDLRSGAWELMSHPGLGEDLDAAKTRLIESRRAELEALCSPAAAEAIRRNGIRLVHYGHLDRQD